MIEAGLLADNGQDSGHEVNAPLKWLEDLDPAEVVDLVSGESPHNTALVIAHFSPRGAAAVLSHLDETMQNKVARRLAAMGPMSSEAVKAVDEALRQRVVTRRSSGKRRSGPSDTLSKVLNGATERARESVLAALSNNNCYPIVTVKSTVTPGTTQNIVVPILEEYSGKQAGMHFGVAMNPEFLREGQAVHDFFNPDRIVIGELDQKSGDVLSDLYEGFHAPILRVDLKTAEMIKYGANTFLATKISFINEVGNICKLMGIDVHKVAKGMGLDPRIAPQFLDPGIGFGGSCLPKDTRALTAMAKDVGYHATLLESVLRVNEDQPRRLVQLAEEKLGGLHSKTIAVLGLAFKAQTDDVREAPSIIAIKELLNRGAHVRVYDPVAGQKALHSLNGSVERCPTAQDAISAADAVFILTEWDEFKNPDLYQGKKVFAGRMVFDPKTVFGFDYEGICW